MGLTGSMLSYTMSTSLLGLEPLLSPEPLDDVEAGGGDGLLVVVLTEETEHFSLAKPHEN